MFRVYRSTRTYPPRRSWISAGLSLAHHTPLDQLPARLGSSKIIVSRTSLFLTALSASKGSSTATITRTIMQSKINLPPQLHHVLIYIRRILNHISTASKSKPHVQKGPSTLEQTSLASLSLRINEPYWMVHRGNCEHFIVVDQIR